MTNLDAYATGRRTGYDIARDNISGKPCPLLGNARQNFISECLETESDHFRQFSPFEFTAHELNDSRDPDKAWESYEHGVQVGIESAVAEHNRR